jgi:hypothetical protein
VHQFFCPDLTRTCNSHLLTGTEDGDKENELRTRQKNTSYNKKVMTKCGLEVEEKNVHISGKLVPQKVLTDNLCKFPSKFNKTDTRI